MEDKHAFLVIAHADFCVLQYLVKALDHYNNDIYIHIDKKVKTIPNISAEKSKVFVLQNRVDVRWGDISMVHAEFNLFERAIVEKDLYKYYHLISGTHFPLRSINEIHEYFIKQSANICFKMETSRVETILKLDRFNFFIKNFNHSKPIVKRLNQLLWHGLIKLQQWMHITRKPIEQSIKASQWMSLNRDTVTLLIAYKKQILKRYQWTLCADEFFIPSTLESIGRKWDIKYVNDLLFCEFDGPNPKVFTKRDLEALKTTECLFARKFNDKNIDVVHAISSTNDQVN